MERTQTGRACLPGHPRREDSVGWTIFYVFDLKPSVPKHAFNITNRPDYLLHFVMDALEREKWSNYSAQQIITRRSRASQKRHSDGSSGHGLCRARPAPVHPAGYADRQVTHNVH